MEKSRLLSLLEKLDSQVPSSNDLVNLSVSFQILLRGGYDPPSNAACAGNPTCSSNSSCTGNNSCYANESCSGNSVCSANESC